MSIGAISARRAIRLDNRFSLGSRSRVGSADYGFLSDTDGTISGFGFAATERSGGGSFAGYPLLRASSEAPNGQASRIDAARSIALTASGVTRALRPLEKLGLVSTVKNKRDARLAMAKLTPAGQASINEAAGIVDDAIASILKRAPGLSTKLNNVSSLLDSIRS